MVTTPTLHMAHPSSSSASDCYTLPSFIPIPLDSIIAPCTYLRLNEHEVSFGVCYQPKYHAGPDQSSWGTSQKGCMKAHTWSDTIIMIDEQSSTFGEVGFICIIP